MKPVYKSLIVAALLGTAGFAAFSQGPGDMCDHNAMMGKGKMDSSKMETMMAKRSADLHAKLKITAAQEAAWTTFTSAMKPPANMMDQRPDRAEMDKLSTPDRIEKMKTLRAKQHADMTAAMDKRDEAMKTFYAQLSAEQKKTFDAEHARMGDNRGDRRSEKGGKSGPAAPKQ
jgi:hypothetical protein